MRTSQKGIDLIKSSESFRSKPYLCPAGVPTIGYGNTKYNDGKSVTLKDKPITETEAEAILAYQVDTVYEEIIDRLVRVPLLQGMYDALVDFVYNIGETNFRKSTLLRKLNTKDYNGAWMELDKWNKSKGKVLNGLAKRRDKEQELWLRDRTPAKDE